MKIHKNSPWISVEERLPELHETVLVYGLFTQAWSTTIVPSCELKHRFTELEQKKFGIYAHKLFDKYGFFNHGNTKDKVLYWMPIPDFPEEK
jgi:hypothetical protein